MKEYYVLKSNQSIKHEKYIRYYKIPTNYTFTNDKWIKEEGFYNQNVKDSLWIYYKYPKRGNLVYSNVILKEEKYNKGEKIGIWKQYIENGSVIKRYDYDLKKEIEPIYNRYTNYPAIAREFEIEGIVKIKVEYNDSCSVKNITVYQSADKSLDKEALRSVKEIEDLKYKYRISRDCSTKRDTIYTLDFKLY